MPAYRDQEWSVGWHTFRHTVETMFAELGNIS
jgi:hypothetical protein